MLNKISYKLTFYVTLFLTGVIFLYAELSYFGLQKTALSLAKNRTENLAKLFDDLFIASFEKDIDIFYKEVNKQEIINFLNSSEKEPLNKAKDILHNLLNDSNFVFINIKNTKLKDVYYYSKNGIKLKPKKELTYNKLFISKDDFKGFVGKFYKKDTVVMYPIVVPIKDNNLTVGYATKWKKISSTSKAVQQLSQLLGSDTKLLLGNSDASLWTDMNHIVNPPVFYNKANGEIKLTKWGDKNYLMSLGTFSKSDWLIMILLPKEKILEGSDLFLVWLAGSGILLFLVGFTFLLIFSKRLTKPINDLTKIAKQISSGKKLASFNINRKDELGTLANAFEVLIKKLNHANIELEKKANNNRLLFDNSPISEWLLELPSLNFIDVNDAALTLFGYSREEFLSMSFWDLRSKEEYDNISESLEYTTSDLKNMGDVKYHKKDGTIIYANYYIQDIEIDDKLCRLGITLDVTDKLRTDIELQLANERFEKVTEATLDVIWDFDIEKQTIYRSKAFELFFGKNLNINSIYHNSIHFDDMNKIKDSLTSALEDPSCKRWELEYRVFDKKGEIHFLVDRAIIIRNKEGLAIRIIGAMSNISEHRKLTSQLSELNESLQRHASELERSNKELEEFAFVASHDLQEPLRMISSFMDLLHRKYKDKLDEKALQYINFATDGAHRMKNIILDLLEYSRSGKTSESIEKVNLNEVISEFKDSRRKLISEKKATIITDELPTLFTYRPVISQIFHNILDNALKYSREHIPPTVTITIQENTEQFKFSISDNGIGIESEYYNKIFIIFQRLHNKDKFSGTGIGLAIVKRQIELLGGKIWVDSIINLGTTFHFTLPKNDYHEKTKK
jgi:PAS domain S-box-containing protein